MYNLFGIIKLERVLILQMPPPPRRQKPNATIILENCSYLEKVLQKFEKSFPLVCTACQDESIDI